MFVQLSFLNSEYSLLTCLVISQSSVSDWVDILTKSDYNEESYDG
jgi:hypothetical protein